MEQNQNQLSQPSGVMEELRNIEEFLMAVQRSAAALTGSIAQINCVLPGELLRHRDIKRSDAYVAFSMPEDEVEPPTIEGEWHEVETERKLLKE